MLKQINLCKPMHILKIQLGIGECVREEMTEGKENPCERVRENSPRGSHTARNSASSHLWLTFIIKSDSPLAMG